MKRKLVILSIFTIFFIIFIYKEFNLNLNQLTRVDVQVFSGESSESETIIIEEETIKALREIFRKIDWEQNVEVEMSRKEDVKATLFFTDDRNMPDRLYEYLLWFHQDNESASIFDREKNAFATIEKEEAQKLKNILVKN
ncbi:hypothetical protein WAK64_08370 [Bacillus spongiae]|uniref:Uncharacterized protein n=1 Tax=Bacillus spongiae TaxID=2683610 RepID=A0ABU8HCR3_9BACI